MTFVHETVLLKETIDGLELNPAGAYVDCTLGGAGHAAYLLSQLSPKGRLFAMDQDQVAIDNGHQRLKEYVDQGQVTFIHANFRHIEQALHQEGVHLVDGVYYDLGVSSPQLDVAARGFSYHQEARLDMRMNQDQDFDAYELVNTWSYDDLARIIFRYGEEKFAKRIASAIERERTKKPIETTTELAEIIKEAIPAATRRTGGHPAKRTFQAIRIAVNDELGALEESLEQALKLLKVGGRVAVISFHSLEDRLVKQIFKQKTMLPELPRNLPVLNQPEAEYRLVNRKVIVADDDELDQNNRARSAKLRIIERVSIQD